MSFFTNLRADRLVTEIRSSNDPTGAATQKAVARLKDVGPGAIESVLAALPDADKGSTMAFVEVLAGLVSQKTFPQFMRGLVEGSPRVVSGISWALTSSRNYPPHLLLEALAIPGISKPTVLEVIAAQKTRFSVRELLAAAYTQEPNEKAALFRVIGEIADQQAIPELIGRVQGKDPIARVHIINTLARFNTPEVQRRQRGSADQLVGILQQSLQRRLHLGGVKARQGVDDVHARNGVLALHAADQLGDRLLVGNLADDAEQRRLLVGLLRIGRSQQLPHAETRLLRRDHFQHRGLGDSRYRERFEQQVRWILAAAGQCPGNSGDDARTAFHQAAHELWECLLADEPGEHLDECHCGGLVGIGQGGQHRLDGAGADILQPRDRLLRGRARGIIRRPDFGDQPVGTQVREKAHSAFRRRSSLHASAAPSRPEPRMRGRTRIVSGAGAMLRWSRVKLRWSRVNKIERPFPRTVGIMPQ